MRTKVSEKLPQLPDIILVILGRIYITACEPAFIDIKSKPLVLRCTRNIGYQRKELAEFNQNIVGTIEVIAEYRSTEEH